MLTCARDQLFLLWHIRFRECGRRLHDGAQGPAQRRGRAEEEAGLSEGEPDKDKSFGLRTRVHSHYDAA